MCAAPEDGFDAEDENREFPSNLDEDEKEAAGKEDGAPAGIVGGEKADAGQEDAMAAAAAAAAAAAVGAAGKEPAERIHSWRSRSAGGRLGADDGRGGSEPELVKLVSGDRDGEGQRRSGPRPNDARSRRVSIRSVPVRRFSRVRSSESSRWRARSRRRRVDGSSAVRAGRLGLRSVGQRLGVGGLDATLERWTRADVWGVSSAAPRARVHLTARARRVVRRPSPWCSPFASVSRMPWCGC